MPPSFRKAPSMHAHHGSCAAPRRSGRRRIATDTVDALTVPSRAGPSPVPIPRHPGKFWSGNGRRPRKRSRTSETDSRPGDSRPGARRQAHASVGLLALQLERRFCEQRVLLAASGGCQASCPKAGHAPEGEGRAYGAGLPGYVATVSHGARRGRPGAGSSQYNSSGDSVSSASF
jgi:hypothetical protein